MTEVSFCKQFLASLDARPIKLSSDYVADPRQLPAQPAHILPRNPKPYTKTATSGSTAQDSANTAASTQAQPSQSSITVTLKPLRPTSSAPTSLSLSVQPQSSIFDLKSLVAKRTGYASDKVKVLWEKRPVTDSKTIREIVGANVNAGDTIDMGVMYVGAPTAAPVLEEEDARPVPNADAASLDAATAKDTGIAGGGAGAGVAGTGPGTSDVDMKDAAGGAGAAQGKSGWEVCETQEFWDDLGSFVLQRVRDEEVAKKLVAGFRQSWKTN